MTQNRPRTRGYDPTWRIFEGKTGFAPHPWSLSSGSDMIRLPAYTTTHPDSTPADMTASLRPEMLDIDDAAPFLPGQQPAGALLPALDYKAMWEQPAAAPRLPPPPGRTRPWVSRPLAAGACVVALAVVAFAYLPAIYASQRAAPAEIAAPILAPPERVAVATVPLAAEPAAVRVTIDTSLPQPAPDALPGRLELALPAQSAEPGSNRPKAWRRLDPKAWRRLDVEHEGRHTAHPHVTLIRTAGPQTMRAFSRELRFVISYPGDTTR
jgi:hypothetical protein